MYLFPGRALGICDQRVERYFLKLIKSSISFTVTHPLLWGGVGNSSTISDFSQYYKKKVPIYANSFHTPSYNLQHTNVGMINKGNTRQIVATQSQKVILLQSQDTQILALKSNKNEYILVKYLYKIVQILSIIAVFKEIFLSTTFNKYIKIFKSRSSLQLQ